MPPALALCYVPCTLSRCGTLEAFIKYALDEEINEKDGELWYWDSSWEVCPLRLEKGEVRNLSVLKCEKYVFPPST